MSRNVDIVAVTLLLAGIAVYSQVRHFAVLEFDSHGFGLLRSRRIMVVPPLRPMQPMPPHIKVMRD